MPYNAAESPYSAMRGLDHTDLAKKILQAFWGIYGRPERCWKKLAVLRRGLNRDSIYLITTAAR